uniref:Uncharacterized protein n=1 Tax=Quercus lobata TaxID=97700 RepID=A0A7N2QWY8_QUELO
MQAEELKKQEEMAKAKKQEEEARDRQLKEAKRREEETKQVQEEEVQKQRVVNADEQHITLSLPIASHPENTSFLVGFPLSISKDSFHKLLEEVSKTINNLDIPTKSASSAFSATPETSMEQLQGALSELEAYFSLSVGAALLDEATLLRFKQASELLVHKPGFLGEGKCYLSRHYLSQLDDLVQSLHISVQKDQETFSLMEKQKKLIDTWDQYKSELNTCSARMSEMVLKLLSQKNNIRQELSELPKIEELLQNWTQEAARFRQRAEDGWKGLSAVFNDSRGFKV